jgi:phage-related protein
LITVYGTGPGTVTVGSVTLNIISLTDYLKIDCEEMNVYRETAENKNNCVSLGEYPSIPEGKSKVTFTGGITSVDIMPRWWML